MFLSKEEKERRVIDLYYYNQGKTFRDIAKEIRMSLNAKTAIIKKKTAIIKKKGIIVSLLLIRNNLLL
jgi:DNA-directed RNA polymerase specialized sigma subunit